MTPIPLPEETTVTTTEAPKTRREIRARLGEIAPYPKQDTPDHARAVAKYLAVSAQRRWKWTLDIADMDSTEYRSAVQVMLADFAALHLLMHLLNTDTPKTEGLSRQIRDAWDDGGEVGSWLWEHGMALGVDPDEVCRLEEEWWAAAEANTATAGAREAAPEPAGEETV